MIQGSLGIGTQGIGLELKAQAYWPSCTISDFIQQLSPNFLQCRCRKTADDNKPFYNDSHMKSGDMVSTALDDRSSP